jgi:hypothetical protein
MNMSGTFLALGVKYYNFCCVPPKNCVTLDRHVRFCL